MKITFSMIALCILVFSLQTLGIVGNEFAFMPAKVNSSPWIIVTSTFMHGSVEHLMLNMLGLFTFGIILENLIDGKKWITLYFTSGFIASFGYMLLANSPFSLAVGASGAIFGLIGCLAIMRPRLIIYTAYGPLPMIFAAILWGLIEFFSLYSPDNIAHSAHLFGLIGGFVLGHMYKKELKWNYIILTTIAILFLIFYFGRALPSEIGVYNIGMENCNLSEKTSEMTVKKAIYLCEDSEIFIMTTPKRTSNPAYIEKMLTYISESFYKVLYGIECKPDLDYINIINDTIIIKGKLCDKDFEALSKNCGYTNIAIVEIGNEKIENINCSFLSENVSS